MRPLTFRHRRLAPYAWATLGTLLSLASVSWIQAQELAQLRGTTLLPGAIWFQDLDWESSGVAVRPNRSMKDTPISVAGIEYARGLGGEGRAKLLLRLDGLARRFVSVVGIDDCENSNGTKIFEFWVDGRKVKASAVLSKGQAELVSVDLQGAQDMQIHVLFGGEETAWDRYALAGAQLVLEPSALKSGARPKPYRAPPPPPPEPTLPIAPTDNDTLSINGPAIIGGGPGRPFVYRIPISGQGARPLDVSARGLPAGLRLDRTTGVLSGHLPNTERTFKLDVSVRSARKRARRAIALLVSRDPVAKSPTPPMGWNSWNVWGMAVDGDKIRAAADALVQSGLAAHGYRYINIDDGWEGTRDAAGVLQPNEKFGDMKALADYVHGLGLRLGIYSSPGPKTCGKLEGSYAHEELDARTWGAWGVDLLKYDWCSYDDIKRDWSLAEQRKPYEIMGNALRTVERDIVYSLCQYGHARVWDWGHEVGANLWRTTFDIGDSWDSVEEIGFLQVGKEHAAGPGRFNDPDMLVVGKVGWGPRLHPTRLSGNEQIFHLTHWSMLAAPLLLGCDLTDLDAFTLDLLTNDEVIAIDQDPLVKQARRIATDGDAEIWARPLFDGTWAVALYNRGPKGRAVTAAWKDLGLSGSQPVRDVWRRKDLGRIATAFTAEVPQHGAILLKVGRAR